MTQQSLRQEPRRAREPMLNAPWTVIALIGSLIGAHAWRVLTHAGMDRLALTRSDLGAGRFEGLVTYLFVHASWAHVLTNSAFTLAFGVPVARLMGGRARGAVTFFAFFIVCGVLAALGFAALASLLAALGHVEGPWALVGASGAASGLMGAAARLIDGRGRVGSPWGRTCVGMTVGWIVINAVLGLSGLTPGAAGMPVAWEAHILGYFAGLILIGPFAAVAGAPGAGA
ncbi:MAG TPA: rhomboid family intramembrane serine protease [Caulobacteraceae bacterium]